MQQRPVWIHLCEHQMLIDSRLELCYMWIPVGKGREAFQVIATQIGWCNDYVISWSIMSQFLLEEWARDIQNGRPVSSSGGNGYYIQRQINNAPILFLSYSEQLGWSWDDRYFFVLESWRPTIWSLIDRQGRPERPYIRYVDNLSGAKISGISWRDL
ncbi:hypothetical protein K491DRAFT_684590 [Lophiostoma macrostomum CBS 122681]|uniref:Uncharacterized protein n=1 Tax=Lophiostoma macrostomum CBS 122681 TaxID=1314788 RepID=A0A6A6SNL6_9PLEO|nr:hypothetical protein K491DRAFT_684590 [Lophiostoma macrostomum CBS 122681]